MSIINDAPPMLSSSSSTTNSSADGSSATSLSSGPPIVPQNVVASLFNDGPTIPDVIPANASNPLHVPSSAALSEMCVSLSLSSYSYFDEYFNLIFIFFEDC